MRRHRGRRSRAKRHLQNQRPEVTPPELESDPEPEAESDPEVEDNENNHELGQEEHPEGAGPQQENVEATFGEYFPAMAMMQMEPPRIVPLSFGIHEFKIAMSRVEIEPENYIWAVKLVQDEEEDADCQCNYHEEERRRSNYPLQENPV